MPKGNVTNYVFKEKLIYSLKTVQSDWIGNDSISNGRVMLILIMMEI
jgi:hypothetical protein